MGVTAVAAVALAVALFLAWKRKMMRITSLLALAAGGALTGGALGSALERATAGAADLTGSLTGAAVGVAVPALLAILLAVWFGYDMFTGASRITAAIGLALPLLAATIPGSAGSALQSAVTSFSSATLGTLASML